MFLLGFVNFSYRTLATAVAGGTASPRARGNFQAERGGAADAGTAQRRWSGAAPRGVQARGAMPALGEAEGIERSVSSVRCRRP